MECENCKKEHNGSYGSGRFCSDHCRRSFVAKQRHKFGKYKNHLTNLHKASQKEDGWKCYYCGQICDTRHMLVEHKHTVHNISCKTSSWNKGLTKETDERVKKYSITMHEKYASGQIRWFISDETRKKISESLKKSIREGRAKGWQTRNVISFAERFWKQVLNNNNIKYCFNMPISKKELGIDSYGCYFLDFAIVDKKVDLEIDGKQHKLEERQCSDKLRDEALIKNGWKVYRVPWNKLKTESDKLDMQTKINHFLTWFSLL